MGRTHLREPHPEHLLRRHAVLPGTVHRRAPRFAVGRCQRRLRLPLPRPHPPLQLEHQRVRQEAPPGPRQSARLLLRRHASAGVGATPLDRLRLALRGNVRRGAARHRPLRLRRAPRPGAGVLCRRQPEAQPGLLLRQLLQPVQRGRVPALRARRPRSRPGARPRALLRGSLRRGQGEVRRRVRVGAQRHLNVPRRRPAPAVPRPSPRSRRARPVRHLPREPPAL